MIRNNNDAIQVQIAQQGALLFRFPQNSCDCPISDSIAFNRTKLYLQCTYFKYDIDRNFAGISW